MNKNNMVTMRVSDEEMDFLKSKVDFFYFDNVSSYIRSLIRCEMQDDKEERSWLDGRRS